MTRALLLIFLLILIGSRSDLARGAASPFASLVSILANPKLFDNKNIIVSGYICKSGNVGYGLFLTKGDCEDENYANGIRLDLGRISKKIPDSAVIVTIEGRFVDWSNIIHTGEPFLWGKIDAANISGRSIR